MSIIKHVIPPSLLIILWYLYFIYICLKKHRWNKIKCIVLQMLFGTKT